MVVRWPELRTITMQGHHQGQNYGPQHDQSFGGHHQDQSFRLHQDQSFGPHPHHSNSVPIRTRASGLPGSQLRTSPGSQLRAFPDHSFGPPQITASDLPVITASDLTQPYSWPDSTWSMLPKKNFHRTRSENFQTCFTISIEYSKSAKAKFWPDLTPYNPFNWINPIGGQLWYYRLSFFHAIYVCVYWLYEYKFNEEFNEEIKWLRVIFYHSKPHLR